MEIPEKLRDAVTLYTTNYEKAKLLEMSKEWAIARTVETLEGQLYILLKLAKEEAQ